MNIYIVSTASVKWNNESSKSFPLLNGVKQGAVISAPLFALYINPLLENLQKCKKGCYMGNICANAFAYADDVVLLSPTIAALRSLITICEMFSYEYKLQFNPDKCTLLIYSVSEYFYENVCITLCGQNVKNVKSEKHLGHTFENSYDIINMESIIRDIKNRSNIVVNNFKPISWEAKVLLFKSQCSSLYGCPLWRLDSSKIDRLCTDWNICSRRILNLSPRTRSFLIHQMLGTLPIRDIIMKRILDFFVSGLKHNCVLISNFFRNVLLSTLSHIFKY